MAWVWRVTKYDPRSRDARGAYTAKAWTSVSEIGPGLTASEYLAVEDAYVTAVRAFLEATDTPALRVTELETRGPALVRAEMPALPLDPASLRVGVELKGARIEAAVRLTLREDMWCELRAEGRLRVRFGFDYYMYVGCPDPCPEAIARVERTGLFVEPIDGFPGIE